MTLSEYLIKAFAQSANSEIQPAENAPPHAERQAPDAHLIEINLRGGVQGRCILAMNAEPARVIAARVLSLAVAAEFPLADVDDELASNTVGELINIALGEYFSARKDKPAAAELSSPRYSRYRESADSFEGLSHLTFICDGSLFDVFYEFSI